LDAQDRSLIAKILTDTWKLLRKDRIVTIAANNERYLGRCTGLDGRGVDERITSGEDLSG
jgi:hypothetical protein